MQCGVRAYTGDRPFLFVSYSHFDADLVYPIIERLVREGYRVWYDDGIHPGEDWTETVADRLDASAVCLAMLTESYVASVNCRNEIAYSMNMGKKVIGIKLTDFEIPKGIRLMLGNTLYLEKYLYSDQEFYQRFSLSHGVAECRMVPVQSGGTAARPNPQAANRGTPVRPNPQTATKAADPSEIKKSRKLPIILAAVAGSVLILLAVLVCVILAAIGRAGQKQQAAASPTATQFLVINTPSATLPSFAAATVPSEASEEEPWTGWTGLLDMPLAEEIRTRNEAGGRAPSLLGILDTGDRSFLAYSVDFKADALPPDTVCNMAYFKLAYPVPDETVAEKYVIIWGNALLQQRPNGETYSLLYLSKGSYTDASGQQHAIQGNLIDSTAEDGTPTDDEESVGYLCYYPMAEDHWYRLLLTLSDGENGNTVLSYSLEDLETGERFSQCQYDLGMPSVRFTEDIGLVLQDHYGTCAGEVRALEFKNARIYTLDGSWADLTQGTFRSAERQGSYRYAAEGDTFYLVSTGVEDKARTLQGILLLKVQPAS